MGFLISAASRGGGLQIAIEQGRANAETAAPLQSFSNFFSPALPETVGPAHCTQVFYDREIAGYSIILQNIKMFCYVSTVWIR